MRTLQSTKDPEAVGLAVLALRRLVDPPRNPTPVEADLAAVTTRAKVGKRVAARMVENFDRIPAATRGRALGKLGDSDAVTPRRLPKRNLNQVLTSHVSLPSMTLRHRNITGVGPVLSQPPQTQPVPAAVDYTVVYTGLHCIDETWWDWTGSDEPYVITSAAHFTVRGGLNVVRTEHHPKAGGGGVEYDDVDSGETRIGPRAACWNEPVANVQLGMSLTTVLFEREYGDPDHYREEVDAAVRLAGAIVSWLYPGAKPIVALIIASGLVTDFFNWLLGTGDDKVGSMTHVLDFEDLETYSRSAVQKYRRSPASTRLPFHFLADINDTDYVVGFEVTRNPPAPLLPQGPVD